MAVFPTTTKYGQQFLGNKNKKEVHDLRNEKTQCQINEFLTLGHGVRFSPDTLDEAHRNGYDNCAYCIGGSKR
jgi:hypothetical protein